MLDIQVFAGCVLATIGAWAILSLLDRWWIRRFVTRFIAKLQQDRKRGMKSQSRLMPESLYIVKISALEVSCTQPNGPVEGVEWSDLRQIEIVTTDRGPFSPDVFWVLQGSKTGCVIPQGATGESELLERFQQLPDFRNEAVMEAMSSMENRRFLCWQKTQSPG